MASRKGLRVVTLVMPLTSISCLSKGLKDVLLHEASHIVSSIAKREYEEAIKEIETCPAGMLIGLEPAVSQRKSGGGAKRAPSAYNEHTGACMKQGKSMKECALAWKTSPKNPKNQRG